MLSAVVTAAVIPAHNVCPQVDFDFGTNKLFLNSDDPQQRQYGQKSLIAFKELTFGKA